MAGNTYYFRDAVSEEWENPENWFLDPAGSIPMEASIAPWVGSLNPFESDNLTLAETAEQRPVIGSETLIYGSGICSILYLDNLGSIFSGTFTAIDFYNTGNIHGGTFGNGVSNFGNIHGGTFGNGLNNTGNIHGGTFGNGMSNTGNIHGGYFTGSGFLNSYIIHGGFFSGAGFMNYGTINSTANGGTNIILFTSGTFHMDGQPPVKGRFSLASGTIPDFSNIRYGSAAASAYGGIIHQHGIIS